MHSLHLFVVQKETAVARFLFGTIPAVGHINPGLPIARKLVEHGHEVWWYTAKRFLAKVEASGARFIPMQAALDFYDPDFEASFPGRRGLTGLARFKWDIKYFYVDSAVGQLHDLTQILTEFPADVLVADSAFAGAAWASEKGGPPWAAFGVSALAFNSRDTAPFGLGLRPNASAMGHVRNRCLNWLFNHVLFRDVNVHKNRVRKRVGLPPTKAGLLDAMVSPFLFLQGTTPAFEYPRSDLPPTVHFVGPFLPDPPTDFTPPDWWDDLHGDRPVVHITQGTVATAADDLLVPTLKALTGEDVLIVATTGGQPVETISLNPLPENARVEQFIPHYHLLPHVDVMITNGGYNGVQIALANGVPLIAAGRTEEKPEICARIAWAGAGVDLKTKSPTAQQIRAAVKQVLSEPRYRQKAQQIQADYARHDAPTEAAHLLERLATSRQPIVRTMMA
jgi:MGT family glycosyltransferase